MAVLVQVGEDDGGVVLERIEDPVAVVSIDVYIGDPLETVLLKQGFNRDSAVVEDAETRGRSPPRVM